MIYLDNEDRKKRLAYVGIKIFAIISMFITAYAFFRIAQCAYITIQWNFPNHSYEAVENMAAIVFKNGKSPYYENFPHFYEVYGPLYYMFTSWLISSGSLFEVAFVQRFVNWVCVFAAMLIFVLVCRKKMTTSFIESLPLAAALGWMLAFFSNEIGSKPGCFAFVFALLGSIYPYWGNFSRRSFTIAITCCAIAFLSKQYFLGFSIAILGWHLLAFGLLRTLFLGVLFIFETYGLLFLLECIYPNITSPFHLYSFVVPKVNIPLLLLRLKEIFFLLWPILLFYFCRFVHNFIKFFRYKDKIRTYYLFIRENYIPLICLTLFLYYIRMAMHGGNNNIYAAHTFIGLLFLSFLHYMSINRNIFAKYISILSVIVVLSTTLFTFNDKFYAFSKDYSSSWEKFDAIIESHNNIYADSIFAQALNRKGKHVEIFGMELYGRPHLSFFYETDLARKRDASIRSVMNGIEFCRYDLLLLKKDDSGGYHFWWGWMTEEKLLAKGYVKVDEDMVCSTRGSYRVGVFKRAADTVRDGRSPVSLFM
jgi:hypothetical protein